MGFYSFPIGKLHKKPKQSRWQNFTASYLGNFYWNLADNVDNFIGYDYNGKVANDANIPSEDLKKYMFATYDFAKGIQTEINHYMAKDRINNASFRQKLDPISKNVLRRQNPLELVFEDNSTSDTGNAIVGSLLRELVVKKTVLASDLLKGAPDTSGKKFLIQKRLDRLRGVDYPKSNNSNNNNLFPPPSPRTLSSPPYTSSGPLIPIHHLFFRHHLEDF